MQVRLIVDCAPLASSRRRPRFKWIAIFAFVVVTIFLATDGCGSGATSYIGKLCSTTICPSSEGERQAKIQLAQTLADDQDIAHGLLTLARRRELSGQFMKERPFEVREEKIDGNEVVWILDLQGSGDEQNSVGLSSEVFLRACFKLTSASGSSLVTEEYSCGEKPRPSRAREFVPEYRGTLQDCLFEVCRPKL
jgi:hypothetical protein